MTRFRIPLLSAALLLAAVAGAQWPHTVNLYFYKTWGEADVTTAYGPQTVMDADAYYTDETSAKPSSDPLSPDLRLIPGERFRVLKVVSESALPDSDGDGAPDIPFELDAIGAVVPLNSAAGYEYEWVTEPMPVPDGEAGIPVAAEEGGTDGTTSGKYGTVTVNVVCQLDSNQKITLFLVTQDTRQPVLGSDGSVFWESNGPIARYGVAYLTSFTDGMMVVRDVMIGRPHGSLANVGNPAPVRPTAALTSYVDGSGQTIAGDELAALVTPTLQAAPADTEDGALTVVPSVDLPLYRYAVETADSLGGEWELLDDWVAREKIPGTAPLGYSAIVPDGSTPLVLPRKAGETSRFYRLVAPGK